MKRTNVKLALRLETLAMIDGQRSHAPSKIDNCAGRGPEPSKVDNCVGSFSTV